MEERKREELRKWGDDGLDGNGVDSDCGMDRDDEGRMERGAQESMLVFEFDCGHWVVIAWNTNPLFWGIVRNKKGKMCGDGKGWCWKVGVMIVIGDENK